jgi:phage terminase large subunit GpA-like protein
VAHGLAHTFDELYSATLQAQYVTESGQLRTPTHLLIDSGGGRTNEVYQFAARDSGRILPCKGASHHMRRPWTINTLANGTALRTIDTGYFKDMLSRLMKDADVSRWSVHGEIDEDYCLQLASEHKILDRKSGAMRWVPVSSGARNHYWDCEVLQCAAADMANLGVHHIAPPPPQMKPQAVAVARDDNRPDWMPPRPERWL